MHPQYAVSDTAAVFSPALLFYKDLIRRNIAEAVRIAGGPSRLRPHVKTHKTREIARILMDAGVTRHKCATIAEAEMAANCGAPDVILGYQPVGPNAVRILQLTQQFPKTRFSAVADDETADLFVVGDDGVGQT